MKKNQSINDNITKVIVTNGTGRRGPACGEAVTSEDDLTEPLPPLSEEGRDSGSPDYMSLDTVSPYSERNSKNDSKINGRKRTRKSESSA